MAQRDHSLLRVRRNGEDVECWMMGDSERAHIRGAPQPRGRRAS
jgi:hypothetical protein